MIYLILKMFVYLLLALIAGAGAGWFLRHLAASRQNEEMQRFLAEARNQVPQFESLVRSRDEQISRLREDLKEKDVRINGLVAELREAAAAPSAGALADRKLERSGPLTESVARLEKELALAKSQIADAVAEAAAAEGEVIVLKAELARAGSSGVAAHAEAVADLDKRLAQKTMDYERLARDLEVEQRRVLELERERALQNKSLRVLHQQLELEREKGQRVASG